MATPTKYMAPAKCNYGADSWNSTSVRNFTSFYRFSMSYRPLRRRKQVLWNRPLDYDQSQMSGLMTLVMYSYI